MNNKRLSSIKNITLLSLMLALTILFCFVPVQIGTITLALMILPTIILAQTADFKTSLTMGILMGIVNYIAWFTTKAASPVAPIFQNPIVCIVPRVLIAVVCYFTRFGLQKTALLLRMKRACNYEYMRDCANENSCNFSTEKADENLQESTPFSNDFADNDVESANTISKSQEGKKTRKRDFDRPVYIRFFGGARRCHQHSFRCDIHAFVFQRNVDCAKHRSHRRIRPCVVRRKLCRRSRIFLVDHSSHSACSQSRKTCKIVFVRYHRRLPFLCPLFISLLIYLFISLILL